MKPAEINLTVYTDSGIYEQIPIITAPALISQNLDGWLFHASAVQSVGDIAEAFPIAVAVVDASAGLISISIDPADLSGLLASDVVIRKYIWTLLAKPAGTYIVKLAAGTITVAKGAGRWA